ncbi:hypothetical protein B296_00019779 [Ensete ventricosum]|uniref:Uncharacterized protein n=1 Tax=Ensete ventricosum TaxID=4639 RepID=A0A426YUM6_ENSVE|nr:hypothetical protein B296_00019779 [Ensete ventricosum]
MRLGTRLECVRSSLRALGAYLDGAREFNGRRPRLIGRLSGVAEMLVGSWEANKAIAKLEEVQCGEAEALKKVKALQELQGLKGYLDAGRAKNREMEEFLSVAQAVRKKAKKDLIAELSAALKKARATIAQYKESPDFKLGLKTMGRINYEFRYKIALRCFWTKHPGLEVEEDPYATLPEDDNVPMEVEVPFDDSDPIAI